MSVADFDITGIASFIETTWKDLQDVRQTKIVGLTELLKYILLDPVESIMKRESKK